MSELRHIDVPEQVRDGSLVIVMSMSGGKDSTACALAMREAGVPHRMVFADTGWEADETYEHLNHLRERLGPIDVVGAPGGMVAKIQHRACFPGRLQRWCTRELKLEPLRSYHDAIEAEGAETVSVVGIRAEESAARAKFCEWEDDETWGGWIWRPIMSWPVTDVIAIHHRHGIAMNKLYLEGHDRVGCYPCIYANKEEIRLVAKRAPERIDLIRSLEKMTEVERAARNLVTPGRYKHPVGTFFQGHGDDYETISTAIDRVVEWSQTSRGGRQLPLLPPAPDGGCFRWGMCEPPTETKCVSTG